jgi:phage terminase large subunit-like protein
MSELSGRRLLDLRAIEAEKQRRARNRIDRYYPDTGPLRRELYQKHLKFFRAGGTHEPMDCCPADCDGSYHRERCFMAANRVGKTEGVGAYEMTCHLTGLYPDWWDGKRFSKGIKAWAAGDTGKTVREIIQEKLMGKVGQWGTGMIPGDLITHRTLKQGISDAIDTIYVRHMSGENSILVLKSFDQRREAFQGSEQDVIWLDEEPDQAVYVECVLRTMTTAGLILVTFTPLSGMSDVVLSYLPGGTLPGAAAAV